MYRPKRLHLVPLVLVLLVSCSSDEPEPTDRPEERASIPAPSPIEVPSPSPSPSPSAIASGCERMDAVVADEGSRREERKADVDGDGQDEVLAIYIDDAGEQGCRAYLAVDDEDIEPVPIWEAGGLGNPLEPSFRGTFDVDGDGDAEIVVTEAAGASTEFVGLFDLLDGALIRIVAPTSSDMAVHGLFATGGSVGHIEAVDCLAPGQVVVSMAVPASGRKAQREGKYDLTRTLVALSGGRLFDGGAEERTLPIEEVLELPEFSGAPFGSCDSL